MTNDLQLGSLYILMAIMLLAGMLISRRERPFRLMTLTVGWLTVFAAGFVLFTYRDDLGMVAQRLKSEATGAPIVAGQELRVPMSVDGHFWVDAVVDGISVRFLVDSGATMTTIGRDTAAAAGMSVIDLRQSVRTGNGLIRVGSARAQEFAIGDIERRNVGLHVATNSDLNVLGMNFLSSLDSWGVEGRWLILRG